MRYTRLDDDGVAIEDRQEEVGLDVGHDGGYADLAVVDVKDIDKVVLLAQVVEGEVGVVIDVAIAVHVVEAHLYGQSVAERLRLFGSRGVGRLVLRGVRVVVHPWK